MTIGTINPISPPARGIIDMTDIGIKGPAAAINSIRVLHLIARSFFDWVPNILLKRIHSHTQFYSS